MISERIKTVPTNTQGVYCMFDLDQEAAYAGQATDLRKRLGQHFIRQNSSVVSYGRLDIWDIAYVNWWQTEQIDRAEKALIAHHSPYLNFEEISLFPEHVINIDQPDGVIQLLSDEELKLRLHPYNRSKQKLEHLLKMIDKIKLAGHSNKTKKTVYQHQQILKENIAEFLNVDASDQSELVDWGE